MFSLKSGITSRPGARLREHDPCLRSRPAAGWTLTHGKGLRTHVDGSQVPVVCVWLWCEVRGAGAWVYLVAARPAEWIILSGLRKDDRVTVSGEARAVEVSTNGQPFIEVIACSIVPHHDMVEAEQEDQAVH
jgi:hypothetical protein